MSKALIGVDLGGTRIKSVALDREGKILQQLYTPTQDGDDSAWKKATAASIEELKSNLGTSDYVVGISAPGLPKSTGGPIPGF